jgi:choline dehydrogenase-like flavoprotein
MRLGRINMMSENTTSDTTGSFTVDTSEKMIFGTENIPKRIRRNKPIPYKVVTHDIVENADVCIIGSGAAGAILANKILKGIKGDKGKKIILIEKGGYYDPEDFNQRGASMMKVLWKNGGIQFTDDLSLVIAQGECLGGSTVINDAVCFDTPDHIKDEWRGKPHYVDIDDGKWKKAIDEVRESISVERLTPNDVSKIKNKNAWILKDACDNHKKDGSPDPYLGKPNERNCKDCATCGTCHYGCHYQTKKDMLNSYIFEALHQKNDNKLKIYCNCDVRKINYEIPENPDVDNKKKIANGVEGKFLGQNGIEKFKLKVNAKVIILSAGSIASSALLLSNNIASSKAGKGLALHPSTTLIAKFHDEVRASEGIPMAYSCEQFSVLNYPNNGKTKGGFMLESIFTPIIQFSLMLPYHLHGEIPSGHPNTKDLMKEFQHFAMAGVMVRDDPIGSIELSKKGNPKINYKLKKNEIDNLVEGVEKLTNLFFEAGAEQVITRHGTSHILTKKDHKKQVIQLVKDIKKQHEDDTLTGLGSAHPQGGNRMGRDPTCSVVDNNCKVHEFDNLFVCDASVFPTSLGVNPQITVMALATMTAENIIENWNDKFEKICFKEHVKDTCDIAHPRTCGLDTLSIMFNQTSNKGNVDNLVNVNSSDNKGWSFDKTSLMINNKFHWRGFIPDPELPEMIPEIIRSFLDDGAIDWYDDYLEGFWKEFHRKSEKIVRGNLNIYYTKKTKDLKIIPKQFHHEVFGDVIKLNYPKLPFVYDLIKIINENNIIGKVFLSFPPLYPDLELGTFVMTKEYSAEWMDDDDHERIIKGCQAKKNMGETFGYWALRIVRKHLLSPVIEVFHFKDKKSYEDVCMDNNEKPENDDSKTNSQEIKCPYDESVFKDKKQLSDHIAKFHHEEVLKEELMKELKWIDNAASLKWTNYTYQVNENFMIGKLVSSPLDKVITEQSEHIEKISEGNESYVIRYTLSTVAGSWIRDQD